VSMGVPFAHHVQDEPEEGGADTAAGTSKSSTLTVPQAARKGAKELEVALRKHNEQGVVEQLDRDLAAPTGETPLIHAVRECAWKEVENVIAMLLDHAANVNVVDNEGKTPLIAAIGRELKETEPAMTQKDTYNLRLSWVKMLLDHGADPELPNRNSNALTANQLDGNGGAIARSLQAAMRLRDLTQKLRPWQSQKDLPKVPQMVRDEVEKCKEPSKCRWTAIMDAYCRAVDVLEDVAGEGGIQLTFPESDKEPQFMPVSAHPAGEPLRKALEACDLILRKYREVPERLYGLLFEGLLPLQVEMYNQYKVRYESAKSHTALARFIAEKNRHHLNGYNWAFSKIKKEEQADLEAALKISEEFPTGKGADKPAQKQGKSLMDVMVDAMRMQKRVVLLAAGVAEKASNEKQKARHRVVHRSDGGREEPTAKRLFRSHEKVVLGTGPEGLLDVARGGIECPNMKSVCKALECLLDHSKKGMLELLRIKMRFDKASDGGWRDVLVNFIFKDDPEKHVCELQVMHQQMMTMRADMGAHKDYAQIRGAIEILEVFGKNWLEEAPAEPEDDGSGEKPNQGDMLQSGGTKDLGGDVEKLHARIAELEKELHDKDVYIDELESQLLAAREGPQAAILAKFKKYDKDGDGNISRQELRSMMHQLDPSLSDDDISAVFDRIDVDGSGVIDYKEFVKWVCQIGSNDL